MVAQLRFYLKHSLNDLRVNKRLTFFALLSIAAGVAAIVSLQTLALMIGDSLEQNLQANNRGDVSAQIQLGENSDGVAEAVESGILNENEVSFFGQSQNEYILSQQGIEALQEWINSSDYAGQVDLTYRVWATGFLGVFTGAGAGTSVIDVETGEQAPQLSPIVVDVATYPFYGEVTTIDGKILADAIQNPNDIVVVESIADLLQLEIGDEVRLSGSDAIFTVRGIVTPETEVKNLGTDIFAGLFGFYYLDWSAVELFDDLSLQTDTLYFRLADPSLVADFGSDLEDAFPLFSTSTTEDLRRNNELLTEQIDTFVTIMGLVSLLLGSIGIINTMQVIVRRRMLEVAVLKTLGLQSEQVTLLFLTEAFLVGVVGSLAGIVLGWLGTFLLKGIAEGIFVTDLPFRIAPSPAINGFIVGVVVATVFGFLPTLTAGQVRPGIVLRPAQGIIPRAGCLPTLGALLLIIVVVSVIVQGILGSLSLAFQVVFGAFIAAGIVFGILSVLIWLIGRFVPSFGIVDLKISLRQMLATRSRGASTLLALVVGVFSLSMITLFAEATNNILKAALEGAGGNVIISMQSYNQLETVEEALNTVDGVNSYTVTLAYQAELVTFEDSETGNSYTAEEVRDRVRDANVDFPPFFNGTDEEKDEIQQEILDSSLMQTGIEARTSFPESNAVFTSGRDLTSEDAGKPVLVMTVDEFTDALGLTAGDKLTYRIVTTGLLSETSEEVTFEIVGIQQPSIQVSTGAGMYAHAGAFPDNLSPNSVSVFVDVEEDNIPELRRAVSNIPGTFALETAIFTRLITSLIGTFTAFPTLVAILGLIVGGVVIANSVALATMERHHEIAVMKAVGLQRERVLGMLLLENAILGLVGGLMGVGFGLIALIFFASGAGIPLDTIPYGTAFLLMLLCVGVALLAALTSAWDASGEKPLAVLRYE